MRTRTKVFQSGNSQAVRIPKKFRIEGDEVLVERKGATLVLRPIESENRWADGDLKSLTEDPADDTFLRPD